MIQQLLIDKSKVVCILQHDKSLSVVVHQKKVTLIMTNAAINLDYKHTFLSPS